jgi:hypothetical protein
MKDTVIVELGNRTPEEARAAGRRARAVGLALCRAPVGPPPRGQGAGSPTPPRG